MCDLLGDEGDASVGVYEVEGLGEEGVERLGGAVGGGGVVADDEGGDEGDAVGGGGQGRGRGAVEEMGVLHVLGEALQEGDGLVEKDGNGYAREVLAHGVAQDAPEVGLVRRRREGGWGWRTGGGRGQVRYRDLVDGSGFRGGAGHCCGGERGEREGGEREGGWEWAWGGDGWEGQEPHLHAMIVVPRDITRRLRR